jgi:hypothetical protein
MTNQRDPGGSKRGLWRYSLVAAVLLVGIPYLALNVWVRSGWGERVARDGLTRAVASATDSAYRVDLESVSFGWTLQDFTLHKIVLTRTDSVGTVTRTASIEALEVHDVHWLSTVLGRPAVDEIGVRTSSLSFTLDFIRSGVEESEVVQQDSARSGITVAVGTVRFAGDTITVTNRTATGRQATILQDVDLELKGLGPGSMWTPGYVLTNSDVALTVGAVLAAFDDSLYAIDMENITANSRDSTFSLEAMRVAPIVSDSVFARRQEYRRDRVDIAVKGAAVSSVDFDAALRDGSLMAELIVLDSLGIDVFSDHRIAARAVGEPRPFLTEKIRDAQIQIAVDSVAVLDGQIRYSERAHDGEKAGTIRFDHFSGSLTNLSNGSDPTVPTAPLFARAHGSLMGSTLVSAQLSVPLSSPSLDLSYSASVGSARINVVNEMLVPLEGIEFVQGEVDTLWLDGSASDRVSEGEIHMTYRDLALRTVDKNSRQQNLEHIVESALASLLLIHRDNPQRPDQDPRVGRFSYTRRNQDTLWGFLWRGARGGLIALIVRGG